MLDAATNDGEAAERTVRYLQSTIDDISRALRAAPALRPAEVRQTKHMFISLDCDPNICVVIDLSMMLTAQ